MRQTITVRQTLEAFDEQLIPLIREGLFLEGKIRSPEIVNHLIIRNQGTAQLDNEFYIGLGEIPEYDSDEIQIDADCNADELIAYITHFRSNPHQFVETYGH